MVCRLGTEDSNVLPMRVGTDGVGASPVGDGRVTSWHRSRLPSPEVALALIGALFSWSLVGEMAAVVEFPGCIIYSFLSRIILFLCSRTTTLVWGGVMIRGLGGLVGIME